MGFGSRYEVFEVFVQPSFYYNGHDGQSARNLWFAIDGVFLTIYGVGSGIFLYVLLKHASYDRRETSGVGN